LASDPAQLHFVHNDDQVLAAERGNLIYIFNFNPQKSFPDYLIPVHREGFYQIVLDSDSEENGGHQRIDSSVTYPTNKSDQLSLYLPSRSCIVLGEIS
jgi:1,4-alpha-glucan branching enzyme